MGSLSAEFDSTLDSAEHSLEDARERYRSVSETEAAPEPFLQAIKELGQQIEELSKETSVTEDRLQFVNKTRARAKLLEEALEAFQERQRLLVERTIGRLSVWTTGFERAGRKYDIGHDLEQQLVELRRYTKVFEKLLAAGEYAKAVTNDRITPSKFDHDLRRFDIALRERLEADAYTKVCLGVLEDLLAQIHDGLKSIDERNPEKTAFGEYLRAIKHQRELAERSLETEDHAEATEAARIGLEGGLMVDVLIGRAEADQRLARSLGEYLRRHDFASDDEIDPLVGRGSVDDLLDRVVGAIGAEVELTVETRIRHLLEEYSGSVTAAVDGSDLDAQTVLEQVIQMYENGTLADIRVEFDQ